MLSPIMCNIDDDDDDVSIKDVTTRMQVNSFHKFASVKK